VDATRVARRSGTVSADAQLTLTRLAHAVAEAIAQPLAQAAALQQLGERDEAGVAEVLGLTTSSYASESSG
jgi:hypothetical protein